ncbi:hypothetical protein [Georgenia faecalis]|uniref:hypothetical protein n=1 Tax=Georgenia faecalis TaxID=2483799 RepID=UPI000FD9A6A9|nr:hypothetical protein [Georgenia faecalis]
MNTIIGGQIAHALGADWREQRDFVQYQVTLTGMNTLLRAAAANLSRLSHSRTVADAKTLEQVLLAIPGFRPARGKQEAVDRMSDLAGVERDKIGPGGKEHIETLRHLARRFAPQILDARHTKHSLAEALCDQFDVPWSPKAVSTMGTITKQGLNMVLAGAERRAGINSAAWATAADEGAALVNALARELPTYWDGKASIEWMRENGSTKWYGSEWAGWYFEEQVRAILNERYPTPPVGGPRVKYGSTTFDYASPTRVWDAKAHTAWSRNHPPDGTRPSRVTSPFWMNDARAMHECVDEQGLGFLVVDGLASLDVDGQFRAWIEANGAAHGKKPSGYVASTGKSRPRKVAWTPLELRAIWIENLVELNAGIAAGWLRRKPQPDWSAGDQRRPRNDKYQGKLEKAGGWQVAYHAWP